MQLSEFLDNVITCPGEGYFCLAVSNGGGGWLEQWYKWPADREKIVERAIAQREHANVYFSSYLFKAPQSLRENVLPTRTIQADLDDADVTQLPKEPTYLIETSPGRHQGYWVLNEQLTLEEHEVISRKITYSIPLCDRSGWPLGRKVRVPETLNHKYLSGPKQVKLVRESGRRYAPAEFEALPEVPEFLIKHYDPEFIEHPNGVETHPVELLEQIKDNIPVSVYVQFGVRQADRSEALWSLMCWAFKAGLTREQVFTLAQGSANNKFLDLRHRADQDLAKDILRAEQAVNTNAQDERQVIRDIFRSPLPVLERKQQIYNVVLRTLKQQGEFFKTNNGFQWYIRRDVGRPIPVTAHSETLATVLDTQFGLNFTLPEQRYVCHSLRSYVDGLQDNAVQGALSHFNPATNTMLLHTGRRTVLKITARGVESMINGAENVIFPWAQSVESFTPFRNTELEWSEELFGDGTRGYGSSVKNLLNMSPGQAQAMLKVWFLFMLFRQAAFTRPIIASFGQPGSGKTTLFKKVYALLYGPYKSLTAVTSMDNFDYSVATDPLVVLDNVDTWEKWLPDRIALSAGVSDVQKRKLYTDSDVITLRRQAMVGVTAHNPKFGREDVADRFLLFSYKRLEHFIAEQLIITDVLSKRNHLWGGVIRDIQRVLSTPVPEARETPQFRIEDFARYGLWIARAIDCEAAFRSALTEIRTSQQAFTLEEEGLLANAIVKLVNQSRAEKPMTAAQLWGALELVCDDPRTFGLQYKNSVFLSKKLLAMQNALRKVVKIEQLPGEAGVRTWLIGKKGEE